jgi:hypothetical protein
MPRSLSTFFVVCLALGACPVSAFAEDPLHARIDALITAKANGRPTAAPADDAEFLRRISLDLTGQTPTAADTRTFLADTAPDKRQKLIDVVLAGTDYPRRMTEALHVMLMERNGDHAEWTKFLRTAFEKNKPWDQIVREILYPNVDDETTRGAAFFWTKRLEHYGENPVDLPGLTRDVGRLFLGVDLQCAQCHDHLFIDDYKQVDFQGLFAFVSHTTIRSDVKFPAVAEPLVQKKIEFASVFKKVKTETGPRLPFGTEVEIVMPAQGEEYEIPPDKSKNFPGVPKFSPLKVLAGQLPRGENPLFTKNIVNRLWFVMMGRGLVHPLDLHYKGNPPSHPELLDLLAQEFAAHQCDIKWLLRELALTQTYQRSSILPDGVENLPAESFLVANEKPLSAEQVMRSMLQATGELSRVLPNAAAESPDFDKLRERFVKIFGNPPREPETDFAPSVKAALFVLNDATFLGWLKAQPGNLIERLTALSEPGALADELYLSVLSRMPTADERADVAAFLEKHAADRPKALAQLVWGLLASSEFAVNH